ncbi:GAF domain-containing protein [Microcella daejeonensis]|uniref:sensor histidine kinase n=1 Tax=Microcella daejeonensis TaxID=2994971 RepID=UPI002271B1CE|nr:GAF domain-containing protein [Microcella daejeonensis]WAB83909.1 GAF domain-containing protein [Microcella daejeonensis]
MRESPDRIAEHAHGALPDDASPAELMSEARSLIAMQERLRGLLDASQAVVEELDLATVLRRLVEAAVALVGGRYGALGVIGCDGRIEEFIHVGMPDDVVSLLGDLPQGRGLLGALIDDPRPIRVSDLGDDPRSVGFPAGHPPMRSFLGVPVRVRDAVYGNLYISESRSGRFTPEDQELLAALAASAGIAIHNARLFGEATRRQRWTSALADITAALLSDSAGDPFALLADRVAELAGGDLVCVIRPIAEHRSVVQTARGALAAQVDGLVFITEGTMVARALATGESVMASRSTGLARTSGDDLGPTMVIPMIGAGRRAGALMVARAEGRPDFTPPDMEMASDFAAQATIMLELAAARADQQRLMVLDDRSRIAADLHDHVIQRIFAAGLGLQAAAGRIEDTAVREQLEELVETLDESILAIRSTVFALTARHMDDPPLRHRILDLISDMSAMLPAAPRLALSGPIDFGLPPDMADDLLGVIREALTNVAKHSGARSAAVSVQVSEGRVTLEVDDDGKGTPAGIRRRSGMANIVRRAERWRGAAGYGDRTGGGTVITWTALIPSEESEASAAR